MSGYDVVVVGSGPNGLAAAVTLARAGLGVLVLEAQPQAGGGARTLPLPGSSTGLVHDVCSAVHPMALASPFFRAFDLAERGVELVEPDVQYAHPLDGGRAGLAYRDVDRTAACLGDDARAWRAVVGRLAGRSDAVVAAALGDRRSVPDGMHSSVHSLVATARLALGALEQGTRLWDVRFRGEVAPAMLTGVAAHAIAPLPSVAAAGAALVLASLAHSHGWPVPRGGSGEIARVLVADLLAHGGELRTGVRVASTADLPPARAYVLDTSASAAAEIFGGRMPRRAERALRRFRHGDAAAKVDFVLDGPVPWAHPEVSRAGTVHLGGSRTDLARAEAEVASGRHAARPVVLLSDPTVADPGRAVGGLRPLWTYAHVPAGSTVDPTEAVTAQVERFAPGFRDVVVSAHATPAAAMPAHDENYVGGDIAAGAVTMWQMLARPSARLSPWSTGARGVYLCSAATPPGPGVHGMGGWFAAREVLRETFGQRSMPDLSPGG